MGKANFKEKIREGDKKQSDNDYTIEFDSFSGSKIEEVNKSELSRVKTPARGDAVPNNWYSLNKPKAD